MKFNRLGTFGVVLAFVALIAAPVASAATTPTITSLTVPTAVGSSATFDVSATATPSTGAGRTITSYTWKCGRCQTTTIKTGSAVSFIAPVASTTKFPVTLTVRDSAGKYVSVSRYIKLTPPMAATTFDIPTTAVEGTTIAASATPSSPYTPIVCKWQVYYTSTATGLSVMLKMPIASSVKVSVTCKDAHGNSKSKAQWVALTTSFTVAFGATTGTSGTSGQPFPVSATITGNLGVTSCTFTLGAATITRCSGGSFTLPTISSPTDLTLTLRVKDGLLRVRTVSRTVTVNPVAPPSPPAYHQINGLVRNGAGNFIVLDGYDYVVRTFSSNGSLLSHFDMPANRADYIGIHFASDTNGNLYFQRNQDSDGSWSIVKLNSAGVVQTTFGQTAQSVGIFRSVAVSPANVVYVLVINTAFSQATAFVDRYATDGSYIGRWTLPDYANETAQALAFDSSGNAFVAYQGIDWSANPLTYLGHVVELDATGNQTDSWSTGLAGYVETIGVDAANSIYLLEDDPLALSGGVTQLVRLNGAGQIQATETITNLPGDAWLDGTSQLAFGANSGIYFNAQVPSPTSGAGWGCVFYESPF